MKFIKKYSNNEGSATIEASLVFIIFIIGYLTLQSLSTNLLVESITRKALFETGMDISNYIQFVDSFGNIENIKTKDINTKEYKDLILENVINEKNIKNEFIELVKEDVSSEIKDSVYEKIVKKIFSDKMISIKGDVKFENLGIKNGINGINISEIKILEDSKSILLAIDYKFNLDKFGIFSLNNNISQSINIGSWVRGEENKKDINSSIWSKSNFVRGKYFAKKFIDKQPGIVIKKGSGVDLYDAKNNTIIQVFSLNLFNKTYSKKINGKYIINDKFIKTIKKYYNELKTNIENMKNILIDEDGIKYEIKNPDKKLIIILPEEAKEMISEEMIKKEIENIDFLYMEKALNDN